MHVRPKDFGPVSQGSRGNLLRLCVQIEEDFAAGGARREWLLGQFQEHVRVDFWDRLRKIAEDPDSQVPHTQWATTTKRLVISHVRGLCAAAMLDDQQAEVLMDAAQRTIQAMMKE